MQLDVDNNAIVISIGSKTHKNVKGVIGIRARKIVSLRTLMVRHGFEDSPLPVVSLPVKDDTKHSAGAGSENTPPVQLVWMIANEGVASNERRRRRKQGVDMFTASCIIGQCLQVHTTGQLRRRYVLSDRQRASLITERYCDLWRAM